MACKVIMPKQGLLMMEGTITKWLKKEGESVKAEEPLFEMETDKLTITINAQESGTMLKIIRGEGETVPITETIAIIGEQGEDISTLIADMPAKAQEEAGQGLSGEEPVVAASIPPVDNGESASGGRVFITPRAKTAAIDKGIDYKPIKGTGPDGLIIEKDVLDYSTANAKAATGTVKATPLAEKMAKLHDIDISGIIGSGAGGKVTKSDVEAIVAKMAAQAGGRGEKLVPLTGLRKIIADRMMESLHGSAQANHRMKVDMSEIVGMREKLKRDNIKVTYTDIFVKVVSKALMEYPEINSTLTGEGILVRNYVNMGIAVAMGNGLIVPVIKNADMMTLEEISIASSELIEKARNGGLMPDDYKGGTFTITNLGMYDIDEFTAIINPPESAILAIGKIDKVPVVRDDEIVIRPVTTLSLTYDHRVVDGAPAAQFLQRVKQLLTNPYMLI